MVETSVEILYAQGACLVVAKPGGVLTQAPPGVDSMERRVRSWLAVERQESQTDVYLGCPHRLDRPVSGALVMATRPRATRNLAEQFADRVVHKTYWAWVQGELSPASGRCIDWMCKVMGKPRSEIVGAESPGAKEAILCYQVHRRTPDGSLVEIGAETGRMHQIRLQLAARGHPVWGDTLYGSSRRFGPEAEDPRERWIALHARQLCLRHPETREAIIVTAPFPSCWPAEPSAGPAGPTGNP